MKYITLVAALATAAVASDFVKVEIGDSKDLDNRNGHRYAGDDGQEHGGFWYSLWGGDRNRHNRNEHRRHDVCFSFFHPPCS